MRSEHRALAGTLRSWEDSPKPGDAPGCRCWAEAAPAGYDAQPATGTALDSAYKKLQEFERDGLILSAKLLRHYLGKSGTPVKLTVEEIDSTPVFKDAMEINRKRFEESIVNRSHGKSSPVLRNSA